MAGLDLGDPGVGRHGRALEPPAHQQHRRPEVAQLGEVDVPLVAEDPLEDRPELGIQTELGVEGVHLGGDHRLGDAHGGARPQAGPGGTDGIDRAHRWP